MTHSKPCRFVPDYGHYLPSHELNCKDTTCRGCQPCTHDDHGTPVKHCTARKSCGQHLDHAHPATCARCIGRTRADVTWISRNAQLLTAAAIEAGGIDTDAAYLAGPSADPFAFRRRRMQQLAAGVSPDKIDEEDYHHPLAVLGRWEVLLREHYHQPPTRRVPMVAGVQFHRWTNIAAAADYVFDKLSTVAQDPDFDWSEMAQEIRSCRSHLEHILNTAKVIETGAPCPSCAKAPALVRQYAHWCERETCEREHDVTGASDRWRCPTCKESWTEAKYRLWVADDFLDNSPSLTATELFMVYGIPESTIRRWCAKTTVKRRGVSIERPPKLRSCGKSADGRRVYSVQQVLDLRAEANSKKASA